MTEWEKAQNGYLYDANYEREIVEARTRCPICVMNSTSADRRM